MASIVVDNLTKKSRRRTSEIRTFIQQSAREHPHDLVSHAAKKFDLTHEGARRHVASLVRGGSIVATGTGGSRRYALREEQVFNKTYALDTDVEEHRVWSEDLSPALGDLPAAVRRILEYGVQEMINNAIDHSEGTELHLGAYRTAVDVSVLVIDDGVGIFEKIRASFRLPTPAEAVVELVKGKITTDPVRHTGEGIFFTSRAVDDFGVLANSLWWGVSYQDRDWVIERRANSKGTLVSLLVNLTTTRNLNEVFQKYSGEGFRFNRTQIPVIVARVMDEGLVSRSAARRLISRLEGFDEVMLDFAGVKSVGQAFVDEIFRVYANAHPERRLVAVNATKPVRNLIDRAQGARTP
jgi:hypothetical protein